MREYPLRITITVALAVFLVFIGTLLPLGGLLSLPIRMMAGQADQDMLVEFITMTAILGYCQIFITPFINQYNLIEITSQGIRIRVFNFRFKWVNLDWDELIAVDQAKTLLINKATVWVITVKELPFWHKLLGWRYRLRWEPVIVMMPELRNRAELIDTINDRIGERL